MEQATIGQILESKSAATGGEGVTYSGHDWTLLSGLGLRIPKWLQELFSKFPFAELNYRFIEGSPSADREEYCTIRCGEDWVNLLKRHYALSADFSDMGWVRYGFYPFGDAGNGDFWMVSSSSSDERIYLFVDQLWNCHEELSIGNGLSYCFRDFEEFVRFSEVEAFEKVNATSQP